MRGVSGIRSATVVDRIAPMMSWPSPPMLITPVRNAMQIPTPTSSSGIDLIAVSASASQLPKAPSNSAA